MERRRAIANGWVFFLGLWAYAGVLGWVVWQNWQWWPAYMDFEYARIREGFELNFSVFPLLLLGLGLLWWVLGLLWRWLRPGLFLCGVIGIAGAALIGGLRWWVTVYEHGRLAVREVTLHSADISEPLTIVHISDLEAVEVGEHERRAMAKVARLQADLVIFTGDLFELERGESAAPYWEALRPHLAQIQPKYGLWGIYGDGDSGLYRLNISEQGPMEMLGALPRRLELDDGSVLEMKGLSLVQSRYPGVARTHIEAWSGQLDARVFSILLGHGPDFIPDAVEFDVDLCLAGHTHGGQVRLPFLGPLVYNSEIPAEWARGFRTVQGTAINVSAGMGSDRFGGLPIVRFRCPTEITRITVIPERR